jgi:hypothetical protein
MTIQDPQRKAAKVTGAAFLLTLALVMAVNLGINERLFVAGNAAETARNVLVHETLFRIGIAGNLVYAAGLMVLVAALYVILGGVSRGLALLATLWRLVFIGTWTLFALNCFTALRLLSGPDYAHAYGGEGAQALARLYLVGYDLYYVGLLFWALASTVYAGLWLKSRYVPRALAVFGIVGSAWCAACTLLLYVFPGFPKIVSLWWFDVPMVLFELSLGVWLLVRGLAEPRTAAARA